jgi:hypothetical protein
MDFTKSFIRAKNPCADGFRWYLRHHRDGSGYQQVLDDLVRDGRVQDACWLLDQVGPTHTVLRLDHLVCDALVFAGRIEVRGSIEAGALLRAGGAIRCGGTLRAGGDVLAGDDVRAEGGLHCDGQLHCKESLLSDWHVHVAGRLQAGDLKVGGDLRCARLVVAGPALVKGDLDVGGDCTAKALSVRGDVRTAGSLRAGQGLICDGAIACGLHLDAGWGVKAGGDIVAAGAIRAGEGLEAGGAIRAGDGYGVFAGLCVQRGEWETSARVVARARPAGLTSGCWSGAGPASEREAVREADHAH